MGLIVGKEFKKLMVGYPTVSDKYDVGGGVLEGTDAVENGDIVTFGTQSGGYKKATALTAAKDVAGIVLATNVKMPTEWPAQSENIKTLPGEAFNLMVRGFIAVACDSTAVETDIKEGAPVYLTAAGKVTTVSASNIAMPWKFMGIKEKHGTTLVAEIVM